MATKVDIKVVAQAATLKFVIEIPTDLTITQMVQLGKYNWANEHIGKLFKSDPTLTGKWECELIEAKKSISSKAANELCNQDGWESAKVDHLLIFGATYPEIQRKNWIVGLGSYAHLNGQLCVLVLNSYRARRYISLYGWFDVWDKDYRFLRVRKLSA